MLLSKPICRATSLGSLFLLASLAFAQRSGDHVVSAAQERLLGEKDSAASVQDEEDVASADGSRVA